MGDSENLSAGPTSLSGSLEKAWVCITNRHLSYMTLYALLVRAGVSQYWNAGFIVACASRSLVARAPAAPSIEPAIGVRDAIAGPTLQL